MKKLTLDQTWAECLKMWKWIAKQVKKDDSLFVRGLKAEWLKNHGYGEYGGKERPEADCFFCDYALRHSTNPEQINCPYCPATLVLGQQFRCCTNEEIVYDTKPLAFYAELKRLNKIRLARKSKK